MSILKLKKNIVTKGGDGFINVVDSNDIDNVNFIKNLSSDEFKNNFQTIYSNINFPKFENVDIVIIKKNIITDISKSFLCYIKDSINNNTNLYNIWLFNYHNNENNNKYNILFETSFISATYLLKLSPQLICVYKQTNKNGLYNYCYLTENINGNNVIDYLNKYKNDNGPLKITKLIDKIIKTVNKLNNHNIKHSALKMDNIYITSNINKNNNKIKTSIKTIYYSNAIYYNNNSVSLLFNDNDLKYGYLFMNSYTNHFVQIFKLSEIMYSFLCFYIGVKNNISDVDKKNEILNILTSRINLFLNIYFPSHHIEYFDTNFINYICENYNDIILKNSLCIDLLFFFIVISINSFNSCNFNIIKFFLTIFNIENDVDNIIFNYLENISNKNINKKIFIFILSFIKDSPSENVYNNIKKIVEHNVYVINYHKNDQYDNEKSQQNKKRLYESPVIKTNNSDTLDNKKKYKIDSIDNYIDNSLDDHLDDNSLFDFDFLKYLKNDNRDSIFDDNTDNFLTNNIDSIFDDNSDKIFNNNSEDIYVSFKKKKNFYKTVIYQPTYIDYINLIKNDNIIPFFTIDLLNNSISYPNILYNEYLFLPYIYDLIISDKLIYSFT